MQKSRERHRRYPSQKKPAGTQKKGWKRYPRHYNSFKDGYLTKATLLIIESLEAIEFDSARL